MICKTQLISKKRLFENDSEVEQSSTKEKFLGFMKDRFDKTITM